MVLVVIMLMLLAGGPHKVWNILESHPEQVSTACESSTHDHVCFQLSTGTKQSNSNGPPTHTHKDAKAREE